ncbi:MAG: LD-carboxypeptidase [Bacteroidales bacterium]|nr:LD-carboxypeptidase [Bacteroidales bacterium]
MLYPEPLKKGDTIAILSPATTVKEEYVRGAAAAIEARGFRALIMPHALGPASGSYASASAEFDMREALRNPEVKAIFCARGGYGAVRLAAVFNPEIVANYPKWLIGFSDISVLHALWQKAGIVSLHAPMAKHLTLLPADDECTRLLFDLLTTPEPRIDYHEPTSPLSLPGEGEGTLLGGNLAVLSHLIGTPYDVLMPHDGEDTILFIEDIGEAIYATERMLWQLYLSGALFRYKGIIAGQFTDARADKNFPSTAMMIFSRLKEWGVKCPLANEFPAGHVDRNLPLPLGSRVRLTVAPGSTRLINI